MATREQNLAWLAEAEGALHRLQMGRSEVTLSYEGNSVTYSQANLGDLRIYIVELQANLGLRCGRTRATVVNF